MHHYLIENLRSLGQFFTKTPLVTSYYRWRGTAPSFLAEFGVIWFP